MIKTIVLQTKSLRDNRLPRRQSNLKREIHSLKSLHQAVTAAFEIFEIFLLILAHQIQRAIHTRRKVPQAALG